MEGGVGGLEGGEGGLGREEGGAEGFELGGTGGGFERVGFSEFLGARFLD